MNGGMSQSLANWAVTHPATADLACVPEIASLASIGSCAASPHAGAALRGQTAGVFTACFMRAHGPFVCLSDLPHPPHRHVMALGALRRLFVSPRPGVRHSTGTD